MARICPREAGVEGHGEDESLDLLKLQMEVMFILFIVSLNLTTMDTAKERP